MLPRKIADSTVRRLAIYLRFLEEFQHQGRDTISSEALANRAGTTSAQVRKDLSFFGSFGKRGLGYDVHALADRLREILGLGHRYRVIIIGAGRLAGALVQYAGFSARGFEIKAVVDRDPAKIGHVWDEITVEDVADLEAIVAREAVEIAILVTPADPAQALVDRLVAAGVTAILNFAPVQLHVPEGVDVKNVNLAVELETLSYALAHRVPR
ncbi:MAG: redox-sensing transcriptional repressor Rex [Gemmatimonadetes bacterium]|nr:redox-sensing transcriptional repressor Rex [Gemmatimonadota bacterium]MCB9517391.1 redox-sensing transcriptional repressor Rex [Gemmatimonadales bacterium]MCA9762151.1 redox-sensing transcriptional repressor Rex [Gemmatimonadota bacterium]MCA9769314.1 redox-sensing transcriptional repressor Rex [Gemmatimonadota bacterium]HPF62091.1 redox-sensing transcriptional repressor Rex [Gemmatimonadales bacterium]